MDYLSEFKTFLTAERRLEPTSIEAYTNDIDGFLNWAAPTGEGFSAVLAEGYLHHLIALSRKPSFVRHVRVAIRRFYHWLAVHQKMLSPDEGEKIDPVRDEWHNLPTLTYEEVQKLINACVGEAAERNQMMIRLLFETGMRVSELCGLNLNSMLPGMKALRITAKGRVDRVIPVTGECFTALQDYARRWRTRHAVNTYALFVNERARGGQRVGRRRVSLLVMRLAKKCGLVQSSSHTLRRSRATQLLNSGVPATEVQEILGHQSIKTTERYFATDPARVRAMYGKCFQPLTGGPGAA